MKKFFNYKTYLKENNIEEKLKEMIESKFSFEEESFLYEYIGNDKKEIENVIEFFFKFLYSSIDNYDKYIWHNPKEEFENYSFWFKYKEFYSEVYILYGQGSTCIFKPVIKEYIDNLFNKNNIKKEIIEI